MMFGNFSQQLKKSTKPASTLLEMNAKTLELISKQQTVFFSGVMTDSVKLMDSLLGQTEMKGIMAAQSKYAESLRDRITNASKTTYGALSEIGNDAAIVIKDSFETATEGAKTALTNAVAIAPAVQTSATATPATNKPAIKKAATKKVVAKKAAAKTPVAKKVSVTTTTDKPAPSLETAQKLSTPQATPPVIEKPAVNNIANGSSSVTKSPAEKVVTKQAASSAKPSKAITNKAAPKKTVADLSPADVKADQSKPA